MLNLKYTFILFSFLFSSECKNTHEHYCENFGKKNESEINDEVLP